MAVGSRLAPRRFDVVILFTPDARALERRFASAAGAIVDDGAVWVCWPKKASGVETDLTENVVRAVALAGGLVDNKVCAIDATWSGLRVVVRVKDRAGRGRGMRRGPG